MHFPSTRRPSRPVRRHGTAGVARAAAALAMWITLAGALLPASAQERSVRVAGVVQWMSTDKMMVIPNDGGLPIEVDITQVSQSQYEYLAAGSPVTVVGIVSPDGRRVIATTLIPGPGG